MIGGAILAAVALAVVAFLALPVTTTSRRAGRRRVRGRPPTTTTRRASLDGPRDVRRRRLRGHATTSTADGSSLRRPLLLGDIGSELEEFGSTCGERSPSLRRFVRGHRRRRGPPSPTTYEDDAVGDSATESRPSAWPSKIAEAIEDGTLTEEQASTEVFDYLADCDISLEEIGGELSAVAACLAPRPLGGRFSVKAAMPSAASSVDAVIVSKRVEEAQAGLHLLVPHRVERVAPLLQRQR